jgi:hypothetical protein
MLWGVERVGGRGLGAGAKVVASEEVVAAAGVVGGVEGADDIAME